MRSALFNRARFNTDRTAISDPAAETATPTNKWVGPLAASPAIHLNLTPNFFSIVHQSTCPL
jgi:hypothetical protein